MGNFTTCIDYNRIDKSADNLYDFSVMIGHEYGGNLSPLNTVASNLISLGSNHDNCFNSCLTSLENVSNSTSEITTEISNLAQVLSATSSAFKAAEDKINGVTTQDEGITELLENINGIYDTEHSTTISPDDVIWNADKFKEEEIIDEEIKQQIETTIKETNAQIVKANMGNKLLGDTDQSLLETIITSDTNLTLLTSLTQSNIAALGKIDIKSESYKNEEDWKQAIKHAYMRNGISETKAEKLAELYIEDYKNNNSVEFRDSVTIEESDAARTGESSTSSSTSSSSSNTGNVGGSTGTSGGNASSSGENNAVQFRKEPSSSTTESTKSEGTKVESKPESNTVESKPTTDNNSSTNTDNNNTNTDNNNSSTNTDNNNTNTDNNNSSTNTDNNNTNTDNNNSSTNTGNNNGSNINTNPIPETPPSNNNSSNNTNNNTNSNYIGSSNNGNKYSNNNSTTTPIPEESNNVATTTPSAPESDNSIIDNSGNELSVISIDKEPTGSQGTTSKSNDGGSVIPIVLGVGAAGAAAVAGAKIIKDRKEQSGANETNEDNFNQENNDSDFSYIGDYNNGFENDNKDESGKYKAGNVNKLILDDTPEDIKIEENFSGFDEKGEELE